MLSQGTRLNTVFRARTVGRVVRNGLVSLTRIRRPVGRDSLSTVVRRRIAPTKFPYSQTFTSGRFTAIITCSSSIETGSVNSRVSMYCFTSGASFANVSARL